MKKREIRLREVTDILDLEFLGEDCIINGLNLVNKISKCSSIISYITSEKFIKGLLSNENVKSVLITKRIYDVIKEKRPDIAYILTDYPEDKFYDLHTYLYNSTDFYEHFNFKSKIMDNCDIHKSAQIENGVIIGNNVVIKQNAIIKKGSCIGNGSVIGCGTIIGSEGFQLLKDSFGKNRLIVHAGGCNIGEHVSIGDNSTVSNSLFEDTTTIGDDTKIDNLVHVAHNCIIGKNCVLTAGVILSGSTIIGNNVWIAPNATISNKVILEDNAFIGIGSVVLKRVKTNTKVFGIPAKEI